LEREPDRRVAHVCNDVNIVHVEPFADNGNPDIRLVLMVGIKKLDFDVRMLFSKIIDCHFGGDHRPLPIGIGKRAGCVVDYTDLDDSARDITSPNRRPKSNETRQYNSGKCDFASSIRSPHLVLLLESQFRQIHLNAAIESIHLVRDGLCVAKSVFTAIRPGQRAQCNDKANFRCGSDVRIGQQG